MCKTHALACLTCLPTVGYFYQDWARLEAGDETRHIHGGLHTDEYYDDDDQSLRPYSARQPSAVSNSSDHSRSPIRKRGSEEWGNRGQRRESEVWNNRGRKASITSTHTKDSKERNPKKSNILSKAFKKNSVSPRGSMKSRISRVSKMSKRESGLGKRTSKPTGPFSIVGARR